MAQKRNCINKKKFIKYLKSLGIDVHCNTKARGHHGFCSGNRIDVSKKLDDVAAVGVLLHEFAHHIHFKLEPSLLTGGGSLKVLFNTENTDEIEDELFKLSLQVFDSKVLNKIETMKKSVNEKVKEQKNKIKLFFPNFKIGSKFKEFDRYIKRSDAKYLLKYDKVLIKKFWFSKKKIISVNSLNQDFPDMPEAFAAYIILKSLERKRNRLNARIYKIKKYLGKPTELFARFVQSYYLDYEKTKLIAPRTLSCFEKLKSENYYKYLNDKDFITFLDDCEQKLS